MVYIIFPKHLTKTIIADIKKTLIKLNILDLSNIEALEASIAENHETSNYQTFRQIRQTAKNKQIAIDTQLFPYENIISLADGVDFLQGTAFTIKKATQHANNKIEITSADLNSIDRSYIYIEYNDTRGFFTPKEIEEQYKIKVINLDNTESFTRQLKKSEQTKYDLIVMNRGLCICHNDFACGGIQASKEGSLYGLLTNATSILDTTKQHSLAVLTGKNNDYNIELWDGEIQQFNIDNQGKLLAEVARNRAGIFKGITINVLNPDREELSIL
jgi:hypothetical protein